MPTGTPFLQTGRSFVADTIDIEGETQATLAFSSTATQTAALTEGVYDLWTDQTVYIEVGTAAAAVTSSNGYIIYSGNVISARIRKDSKIGAVRSATSGTLSYHKVG